MDFICSLRASNFSSAVAILLVRVGGFSFRVLERIGGGGGGGGKGDECGGVGGGGGVGEGGGCGV